MNEPVDQAHETETTEAFERRSKVLQEEHDLLHRLEDAQLQTFVSMANNLRTLRVDSWQDEGLVENARSNVLRALDMLFGPPKPPSPLDRFVRELTGMFEPLIPTITSIIETQAATAKAWAEADARRAAAEPQPAEVGMGDGCWPGHGLDPSYRTTNYPFVAPMTAAPVPATSGPPSFADISVIVAANKSPEQIREAIRALSELADLKEDGPIITPRPTTE